MANNSFKVKNSINLYPQTNAPTNLSKGDMYYDDATNTFIFRNNVGSISFSSSSLTDGHIFVGNGSNVASDVALSGEASIANTGAITLGNAAIIGKVITGFTSGSGALAATDTLLEAIQKLDGNIGTKQDSLGFTPAKADLSNIASVAINTSLISDTDDTDDLGSSAIAWKEAFINKISIDSNAQTTSIAGNATADASVDYTLPANAGTNGYVLTTNGSGGLTWAAAAATGASLALDNLASVAINTSLISDTDNTDDLGSAAIAWKEAFVNKLSLDSNGQTTTIAGSASASASVDYILPVADGSDGQVLKTNGSGTLAWITPSGSGASTALDNLAAVAINTSLISDTDNTDDLGSSAIAWKETFLRKLTLNGSTSGSTSFIAGATPTATIYTLPSDDGSSAQALTTNGTGTLSWTTIGGDGLTKQVITTDTTMTSNNGYVANKNTAGKVVLTLPATSTAGDVIQVIGQGTGGWSIYSNASVGTQKIHKGKFTSAISSSNAIPLYNSVEQYDTITIVCSVANSEWTMLDGIGGVLSSNYYGTGADGDLNTAGNVTLTASTDDDVIVKNYGNITINNGHTLTVADRTKGLVLYATGDVTVNTGGIISMSTKGAKLDPTTAGISATGIRLVRFTAGDTESLSASDVNGCGNNWINAEAYQPAISSNGKIFTIPRAGASGAAGRDQSGVGSLSGNTGTAGSTGQSGGGGGGALSSPLNSLLHSGAGAAGTCFGGGSGGGAVYCGVDGTASPGAANCGAGGNAFSDGGNNAGSGAGNPAGGNNYTGATTAGLTGCGGVLYIIARGTVTVNGSILARGSNGGGGGSCSVGGGASGGGAILILYGTAYNNAGTVSAAGGVGGVGSIVNGGSGGAGSVQTYQINI